MPTTQNPGPTLLGAVLCTWKECIWVSSHVYRKVFFSFFIFFLVKFPFPSGTLRHRKEKKNSMTNYFFIIVFKDYGFKLV